MDFNFDVIENAQNILSKAYEEIQSFYTTFDEIANGLNIDVKKLETVAEKIFKNSDDYLQNSDAENILNESDKQEIQEALKNIDNILENIDITKYTNFMSLNEKYKDELKKIVGYEGSGGIWGADFGEDTRFRVFSEWNEKKHENKNGKDPSDLLSVPLYAQLIQNQLAYYFDGYMEFGGGSASLTTRSILNWKLPLLLLQYNKMMLTTFVIISSNELKRDVAFDNYFLNPIFIINSANNYQKNDGIFQISRKNKKNNEWQEGVVRKNQNPFNNEKTIEDFHTKDLKSIEQILKSTENISEFYNKKSMRTFAYENKYNIQILLPDSTTQIIDNIHFISSSIPSFSMEMLENRINNLKRKSGGNINSDTFSISIRDNAKREYYSLFMKWFNLPIHTQNWDEHIRLHRYPSEYFGKIKFFMLHSAGGIEKVSNNIPDKYDLSYDNLSVEKTYKKGIITKGQNDVRQKSPYWLMNNKSDFNFINTIMNNAVNKISQDKNLSIDYINNFKDDEIKARNDVWFKKNYIVSTTEFSNVFPIQISDVILNSGSSELSTFDVTFEYTFPVQYTKINKNSVIIL